MTEHTISLGYVPRPWQARIHREKKRFSIAIVHRRGGKTYATKHELIHCALERPNGHYAYIGPTLQQARKVMWNQLKDACMKVPHTIIREVDMTVEFANKSMIRCLGAQEADGIRGLGFDGAVCDEFQMWDQTVVPLVIMPTLAGRNGWLMMIGTPSGIDALTQTYEQAKTDPEWACWKFTVHETGALSEDEIRIQRKNMLPRQFALEYECNFDSGSPAQLITGEDVNAAFLRVIPDYSYLQMPRVMGVDIARQGDDRTVIFRRMGMMTWEPVAFQERDLMVTTKRIAQEAHAFKPVAIFIDGGGVGAGAVDACKAMGLPVIEVQFGAKAADPRYKNMRAEMYFTLAHWIINGGRLHPDPDIKMELTAPSYKQSDSGQLQLESKEDIKGRGLPSPDKADALALTFAMPVLAQPEEDKQASQAKDTWNLW